jgi:colanic acid biosynthesis glycosyl transferase WcaI
MAQETCVAPEFPSARRQKLHARVLPSVPVLPADLISRVVALSTAASKKVGADSTRQSVAACDIAIVTAWFPPEAAPFGQMMFELAHHLVETGLKVDVITSIPNHPEGVLFDGWRNRLLQVEHPREGLRILRVGALLRGQGQRGHRRGRWQRIAGYLTFTALVSLVASWRVRPRLVFGVLQPLTIAPVLSILARLRGARLAFNVQDLHPDAAISLGLVRNPWIIRVLKWLERGAYRKADALAVISAGFRDHCVARGAAPDDVAVIPNWIDLDEIRPLARQSSIRAELGIAPEAFVALYAGTIGHVSGAQVMLEAAALLQAHADLHVVFIGEGPLVPGLQRECAARGLARVHFLPFQPRARLNEVQGVGDVSVVTLLRGYGRISIPSKILGYMAAARPVIAAVDADSETARFISSARGGLVIEPENAPGLAAAIVALRDDRARARALGLAGRSYLEVTQSKGEVLERYRELFHRLLSGP